MTLTPGPTVALLPCPGSPDPLWHLLSPEPTVQNQTWEEGSDPQPTRGVVHARPPITPFILACDSLALRYAQQPILCSLGKWGQPRPAEGYRTPSRCPRPGWFCGAGLREHQQRQVYPLHSALWLAGLSLHPDWEHWVSGEDL